MVRTVSNFLALCACSLFILATDITGLPWDICNEMGSAFKEYVHDDPSVKANIFIVDYPGNQPLCVFPGKPPKCDEKDFCDARIYVINKESSIPLLLDFLDERNLSYNFPANISRTFDIEGNYMFEILLESNLNYFADRAIASVSPERLSHELKTHRSPTNDPIQLKMKCNQWKKVDTDLRVFAWLVVPMAIHIKVYAATKKDISVKIGDYEKTLVEIPKEEDDTLVLGMWSCSEGLCYNTTKRKNLHIQFICHKIISKEECWAALSCEWKNQTCLNETNFVTKKQEYSPTHANTLIYTNQDHITKSPEVADVSGNLNHELSKIILQYLKVIMAIVFVLSCALAICCIGGTTYLVVQWCKKKQEKINPFKWLKRRQRSNFNRSNDLIELQMMPDQNPVSPLFPTRENTAYSGNWVDYIQNYELNQPRTDTNQQTITASVPTNFVQRFDVEHPRQEVDEIITQSEGGADKE